MLCAVGTFVVFLAELTLYDLTQRQHAILRNFPIIGHLRYLLEAVGPELRQYIVTDNDEERPFSRDQRRWVYSSAKLQNNYFGFGTDNDIENAPNYLIIKQAMFPLDAPHPQPVDGIEWPLPCSKVLGTARGRRHAFRPQSAVGISGMSFGSLGEAAVEALNRVRARRGAPHQRACARIPGAGKPYRASAGGSRLRGQRVAAPSGSAARQAGAGTA